MEKNRAVPVAVFWTALTSSVKGKQWAGGGKDEVAAGTPGATTAFSALAGDAPFQLSDEHRRGRGPAGDTLQGICAKRFRRHLRQ